MPPPTMRTGAVTGLSILTDDGRGSRRAGHRVDSAPKTSDGE